MITSDQNRRREVKMLDKERSEFFALIEKIFRSRNLQTGDNLLLDLEKQTVSRCQQAISFSAVILSGPNGAGKDTVGKNLGLPKLPNVTTRGRRPDEIDGVDYIFMTEEEFQEALRAGQFLTHKKRHGKDWHGLLRDMFFQKIKSGEKFMMDKSPLSLLALLKELDPGTRNLFITCYILPPSFEEWLRRLTSRTAESEGEDVRGRIRDSLYNLKLVAENPSLYDVFIINDEIERATAVIKQLLTN